MTTAEFLEGVEKLKKGGDKNFIHDFGFQQTKLGKMYQEEEEQKKKMKIQKRNFDHGMQVVRAQTMLPDNPQGYPKNYFIKSPKSLYSRAYNTLTKQKP